VKELQHMQWKEWKNQRKTRYFILLQMKTKFLQMAPPLPVPLLQVFNQMAPPVVVPILFLVSVPSAANSINQNCTVCIRFHPETTQSIRVSVNPGEQKRISRANYQVDYVNHLIPHLQEIFSCPFYLGKMDRYEAEALLACKPEGSFLLRDSAQENYVFSVSFRRYSRSLHARIEETNHKFSFDCHDPGVHASRDIRGLLDFYKDPLSCMFFEPMLLFPILRKKTFSLQELARTVICDNTTYDGIAELPIPKTLHPFLREYHYKHKVESRALELNPSLLTLPNSEQPSMADTSSTNLDVMPKQEQPKRD